LALQFVVGVADQLPLCVIESVEEYLRITERKRKRVQRTCRPFIVGYRERCASRREVAMKYEVASQLREDGNDEEKSSPRKRFKYQIP